MKTHEKLVPFESQEDEDPAADELHYFLNKLGITDKVNRIVNEIVLKSSNGSTIKPVQKINMKRD